MTTAAEGQSSRTRSLSSERRGKTLKAFDPAKLLPKLLEIYERQVRRELGALGADDDEVEIQRRVKAMRDWARFCLREKDPEIRKSVRIESFGKEPSLEIRREPKGSNCRNCRGYGWFFSEACTPREHNSTRHKGRGFVTCECAAGKMRNTAIANHGKNRMPTRSKREEF